MKIRLNKKFWVNKKIHRVLLTLFILAILSSVMAIKMFIQPLSLNERVIENRIEEKAIASFFAVVKPSTLYPNGGKVIAISNIFKNLTNDIIFIFDNSIVAEKPFIIDGSKEIIYTIEAENLWERDFILSEATPIQSELASIFLMNDEAHINLSDIYYFLNNVEEETANRANYSLVIKQKITGIIYDENKKAIQVINKELLVPFEVFSQYIKYTGNPEEKETKSTLVIDAIKVIPQRLDLFGFSLSIMNARIGFSSAALVFLILFGIYKKRSTVKLKATDIIEKKNRRKIIPVNQKISMEAVTNITLKSLNDLIKISDEKEEEIYKYSDSITTIYYIVHSSFIYTYQSTDNQNDVMVIDSNENIDEPLSKKNDVSFDAEGSVK